MNNQIDVVYLLGAGRSGTTILSTILNANEKINSIGELHQFYEYLLHNKACSCSQPMAKCPFWKGVVDGFDLESLNIGETAAYTERLESHRNVFRFLLGKPPKEYLERQKELFSVIEQNVPQGNLILDTSKYLARFLLLRKSPFLNVKGIYVIRDVRGVVNSFGKKVQTSRSPISAILYYLLVNTMAQFISWRYKDILKIRYEDFVNEPEKTLKEINIFLELDEDSTDFRTKEFEMPHIVGGNRIKTKSKLKLTSDERWKSVFTKRQKTLYYLLAFPIMVINKYKIL